MFIVKDIIVDCTSVNDDTVLLISEYKTILRIDGTFCFDCHYLCMWQEKNCYMFPFLLDVPRLKANFSSGSYFMSERTSKTLILNRYNRLNETVDVELRQCGGNSLPGTCSASMLFYLLWGAFTTSLYVA